MKDLQRKIHCILFETLDDATLDKAVDIALELDNESGTANDYYSNIVGIDPEEVDTMSEGFQNWVADFYGERVDNAYYDIFSHIQNGSIMCYRSITGPAGISFEKGHPGVYWAYVQNAAESHWGQFKTGNVEYLLTAKIPISSIDWAISIASNASLDYESEKEIRIFRNAPINILNVSQNRVIK